MKMKANKSPLLSGTHKIHASQDGTPQDKNDAEEGELEGKMKTENDFQTIHVPGTGTTVTEYICSGKHVDVHGAHAQRGLLCLSACRRLFWHYRLYTRRPISDTSGFRTTGA